MRLEIETKRFYLGRDYSEAVEAAGGIPVHIPLLPKEDFIAELLADLDGVLLPGSDSDVDPDLYGEAPHPRLKRVVPEKDSTDMLVLAEAERLGLPLFAICYGMQALNVFRGGTLIQDIEGQVESPIKHEQGLPLDRTSHRISLIGDGILREIARGDELKVNSHHHQAISVVGKGLKVTAKASDGVAECVEDVTPSRFVLGVQWHPELSWGSDKASSGLFETFVRAASSAR